MHVSSVEDEGYFRHQLSLSYCETTAPSRGSIVPLLLTGYVLSSLVNGEEWAEMGEHWSARACLLWFVVAAVVVVVCFVIAFKVRIWRH